MNPVDWQRISAACYLEARRLREDLEEIHREFWNPMMRDAVQRSMLEWQKLAAIKSAEQRKAFGIE